MTQRSDVEDLVSLALEGYSGLDAMITNPGHALLPALDELRVDEVVARPPAQAWRAVE